MSQPHNAVSPTVSDDNIDFFFTDPTVDIDVHRRPSGHISVLYSLRREVQDCLFGEVLPEDQALGHGTRNRLFASSMVMMACIDLLGKFVLGTDKRNSEAAFNAFAIDYLGLPDAAHVKSLIAIRGALMHSFGLYLKYPGITFSIVSAFTDPPTGAIVNQQPTRWTLVIDELYRSLIQGIASYKAAVINKQPMRENFAAMYGNYGTIRFRIITPP